MCQEVGFHLSIVLPSEKSLVHQRMEPVCLYNNVWIEGSGLVDVVEELIHTASIILQDEHRETPDTIKSLTWHFETLKCTY